MPPIPLPPTIVVSCHRETMGPYRLQGPALSALIFEMKTKLGWLGGIRRTIRKRELVSLSDKHPQMWGLSC